MENNKYKADKEKVQQLRSTLRTERGRIKEVERAAESSINMLKSQNPETSRDSSESICEKCGRVVYNNSSHCPGCGGIMSETKTMVFDTKTQNTDSNSFLKRISTFIDYFLWALVALMLIIAIVIRVLEYERKYALSDLKGESFKTVLLIGNHPGRENS